MKTDWTGQHPIVTIIVSLVLAATVLLFGGAVLAAITGWDLKEFVTERTLSTISSIPGALWAAFFYRYLTTGQLRHVQAPSEV